jgi:uncharacterized protein (TIGR03435 family)
MTGDVVGKRDFSRRLLLAVAGFAAVAVPVMAGLLHLAQSRAESRVQNTSASALQYEVASIKPNKYSSHMLGLGFWIERFTATGVTLQGLIREAYEVEDNQISGAPLWLDSERYDIEAKADKSAADELLKLSFDQRRLEYRRMLQELLADRFRLTLHRESKELPVYALVLAKKGPKLQEAKPGDTYPNGMKDLEGHGHGDIMRFGTGILTGQGVPIAFLVRMLSQQQLGRPVLDKTGLTGKYDFTLEWTPEENRAPMFKGTRDGGQGPDNPPDSSGPSIFTAIQEQLGLKLEAQKGPAEVLVIDHVERPSEN